ncbi:LuxR family transcriptional regulator [Streptomyces carpinensis]|uniref:LuxR family transcriptional regulator n=1 Tax=Streptomyces carpinensis TaxID=66369 RepID=A0ABV1WA98_9ACTN|nr:LuxR family transcriptional regulator [Streptomyces carpinensis]
MAEPEAAFRGEAGTGSEHPAGSRPADDEAGIGRRRSEPPLLTLLGFGADEDLVYRSLVDRPGSEPADLTGRLPENAVRRALDALVERGLASVHHADADTGAAQHYRATSPLLALAPLREARRAALHRAEFLATDLAERHRAAQAGASGAPVEVLSGTLAIRRRLIAMQERSEREVCALVPAMETPTAISFEDNLVVVEHDSMRRGVLQRSVVERGWLERPDAAAVIDDAVVQGQQISVVEQVPIKMVMADRRTALLPLDPERDETEPVALVVHRSGLLTALVALFEQCFAGGRLLRPFAGPRSGEGAADESEAGPRRTEAEAVDDLDRRILALLYVGLTDAAVARQLGMGHRTVQRRLGDLMRRTGATTRFQLGWEASRAGWLD